MPNTLEIVPIKNFNASAIFATWVSATSFRLRCKNVEDLLQSALLESHRGISLLLNAPLAPLQQFFSLRISYTPRSYEKVGATSLHFNALRGVDWPPKNLVAHRHRGNNWSSDRSPARCVSGNARGTYPWREDNVDGSGSR